MLGNSLKSEFKFRAASKIQMSPDVVCFLIADAVFNGFVYFRILSCERTLRRKFGNSRNCSSGIPMTTYPRFSPERDSTTISVLWATTSKRTLLLISNNEYGKCRMTRQQADFYEARGKAILEKTFPGPERADLRTGEVGICQFVEKRSFQEARGDVNHEGAKSGSLQ